MHPKYSRWKPSAEQMLVLQSEYEVNSFPSKEHRARIASQIDCSERRVQVWFQNKRQRERPQTRIHPPIPENDFAFKTLQSVYQYWIEHNSLRVPFAHQSSEHEPPLLIENADNLEAKIDDFVNQFEEDILNIAQTPTMGDIFSLDQED